MGRASLGKGDAAAERQRTAMRLRKKKRRWRWLRDDGVDSIIWGVVSDDRRNLSCFIEK